MTSRQRISAFLSKILHSMQGGVVGFRTLLGITDPNRAGFDEFLADMGQAGLPYTASGGSGSVQFGDGGSIIDIMRNYGTGGDAWQYLMPEIIDDTIDDTIR
jgi:hypothetical protein